MTYVSKRRSGKQNSVPASQPEKKPNELRIEASTEEEGEKKLTRGVLSPHFSSAMVSKNHWEKMTERELNYNNLPLARRLFTARVFKWANMMLSEDAWL